MNANQSTTMYESVPVVSELNKVTGFDPLKFIRRTNKGEKKLDLKYKKLWFRLKYPNGRIKLSALKITDQLAIIEARVYFDKNDTQPKASFIAQRDAKLTPGGLYTLEQFIDRGWLLDFTDIYRLDQHREEIIRMDGFGEKSWQRLWNAIQKSRNTSFERYLIAMDIPMIGSTASSALGSCFDWSLRAFEVAVDTGYDFTQIPDFGETLQNNIFEWFSIEENRILWEELKDMVSIEKKETNISEVRDNPFVGKTLVVTGKVEPYTRDGINAKITSLGAKAGSSVSKNTDYLICGENAGSKLTKAQSLGVTVLSPAEFFSMIGE